MSVNLFDANFYRAANSDLRGLNDTQALSHFQNYGLQEGRSFSPYVDLNFYRASNSDLASLNNSQAYDHLSKYGIAEGRKFSPLFDEDFYRTNNHDLASLNNEQLFEHLRNFGVGEGRQFSPLVDLNFYRGINGDLSKLNNNQALQHLEIYGLGEGRRFSPFVDLNLYQAANPDLSAAGLDNNQLLEHLAGYGVAEGRRFSISFDSNYYRNSYADLAAAHLNNTQLLEHFENYGLSEGRASSEAFNVKYYLDNNSDLKAAHYSNQQAEQHFEIYGFREGRQGAPPSPNPPANRDDNTLGTAFNLGFLNSSRNITNQFVGTTDREDDYRFTLLQTSNFNLSLTGLTDSAYAELIYDSNGNGQIDNNETLNTTSGSQYGNGSINKTLGAGTYFIRVYTYYSSQNTNYTLGVSATASPPTTPKDPGNSLNTALDVGSVSNNRSFTDFVGTTDRNDYYRFSLAQTSNFNLSLSNLTDSANVQLIYDSNGDGQIDYGESLDSSSGSQYGNGSITKTLGAGNYFIRVYTNNSSQNTNYTLGLSATRSPSTTPTDPGNSLNTALNVGTLSGTSNYKDFVGSTDRDDYYRFTLAQTSNFKLSLTGLTDSAYADLIYDNNGNGQIDYGENLGSTSGSQYGNGSINKTLGAGTYSIHVYTYYSSQNTNYTLSLSA